jgi:hypothetical protein
MGAKLRARPRWVNPLAHACVQRSEGDAARKFFVKFFSFIFKNKLQIFSCRNLAAFLISSPLAGTKKGGCE